MISVAMAEGYMRSTIVKQWQQKSYCDTAAQTTSIKVEELPVSDLTPHPWK